MDDQDNAAEGRPSHLIRFSPKSAPFRRGGLAFPSLDPVIVPRQEAETLLSEAQVRQLTSEPLIDVDVSDDAGETWSRFEAPAATDAEEETRSRRKR